MTSRTGTAEIFRPQDLRLYGLSVRLAPSKLIQQLYILEKHFPSVPGITEVAVNYGVKYPTVRFDKLDIRHLKTSRPPPH